jgi:O-antigen/teichoic acid export membrane protein
VKDAERIDEAASAVVISEPSVTDQVHHGILYLVPVAVGALLPIVSLPIVTRILTAEDYGAWTLANVYGTFVTSVLSLGLPIAYERNFFESTRPRDRAALLYSVSVFVAAMCAVGAIATFVSREHVSRALAGTPKYAGLMFWAYCATAVVSTKIYFLTYLRNTGDARSYVRYTLDENVTGTVLAVLLIGWAKVGVIGLAIGQLSASALVLGLMVRRARKDLPPALEWPALRRAIRIGLPLTPRSFLRLVTGNLDKYFVAVLSSTGGVGVYAIGQRVGYSVFILMNALENVFNPQVYRRMFSGRAEGGAEVGELLTPYIYFSVGAAVLVTCAAPEGISVLTPPGYHSAIPVAGLLAFYYASLFFGKIPQLVYAKKTSIISALTILTLVLNAAFCTVMARRWGATGAAAGMLASGLLSGAVYFVVSQRYYPIRWAYPRIALMFLLLAFAVAAMPSSVNGTAAYYWSVAMRASVLLAYAALGAAWGYLTIERGRQVVGEIRARFSASRSATS